MFNKTILSGTLTAFLLLGLFGTAFAGQDTFESLAAIGTEGGNWELTFVSTDSQTRAAARNYDYDYEALAAMSTEAGNWEVKLDSPVTGVSEVVKSHEMAKVEVSKFDALAAIGTEGGNWELNDNPLDSKAIAAARDYNYNDEALAAISTEAGNWEFNAVGPDAKTSEAAKNHIYNYEALAAMSTEGGNWEVSFDSPSAKAGEDVASDSRKGEAVCIGC